MEERPESTKLIKEFAGIVSCDDQQARFYLEANGWDINLALSNYYEGQESNAGPTNVEPEVTASGSRNAEEPFQGTQSTATTSSYTTFSDMDKKPSEEDEDDEENENLFAGGEKSGIFMQNPNAKLAKQSSSLVSDILKKAAEGGHGPVDEPEATTSTQRSSPFTGTGHKLGSNDEPSTVISPTPTTSTAPEEPLAPIVRRLTFWRNGFSIEDGPLMSYDDPANEEFLRAINSGRAPLAWLNVKQGQPVDVRVARKLDEDYKEPPKPRMPFSGTGQRLGSPTPAVITSSTPGAYPSTSSSSEPAPRVRELEIDESLPITSIQIRLGDGTRMLARFNHTHTVGDIRNFINASRIGEAQRNYILQTTFPSKDLKDETQSLSDASLLNSVVVQRYT